MTARKPTLAQVRAARPLSDGYRTEPGKPFACSVCGQPSSKLQFWRECDERDRPIDRGIFLGGDHRDCRRTLDQHPRLYVHETGDPGFFPRLCGDCKFRHLDDIEGGCTHPDLKMNGGQGLRVDLTDPMRGVICALGGDGKPVRITREALACVGREVRS